MQPCLVFPSWALTPCSPAACRDGMHRCSVVRLPHVMHNDADANALFSLVAQAFPKANVTLRNGCVPGACAAATTDSSGLSYSRSVCGCHNRRQCFSGVDSRASLLPGALAAATTDAIVF
eukprot:365607-Chlamydomonas_euryale.AAC.10